MRTLNAFNPDRSATKKGHWLIAELAACASRSHEEARRKETAVAEEEKEEKKMMMKRDEKKREEKEESLGSLVAMRVPITGGGLESRCDATLCVLIASCTRRRRRYVQQREPTYRTRSRGPIGHCNDQSSFDILSPCSMHICAETVAPGQHGAVCTYACTHTCDVCTHVMSRSTQRSVSVTTTTVGHHYRGSRRSRARLTPGSKQRGTHAASCLACIGSRLSTGLLGKIRVTSNFKSRLIYSAYVPCTSMYPADFNVARSDAIYGSDLQRRYTRGMSKKIVYTGSTMLLDE